MSAQRSPHLCPLLGDTYSAFTTRSSLWVGPHVLNAGCSHRRGWCVERGARHASRSSLWLAWRCGVPRRALLARLRQRRNPSVACNVRAGLYLPTGNANLLMNPGWRWFSIVSLLGGSFSDQMSTHHRGQPTFPQQRSFTSFVSTQMQCGPTRKVSRCQRSFGIDSIVQVVLRGNIN